MLLLISYVLSIFAYNYERSYTNMLSLSHFHLTRNPILIRRVSPQILFSSYGQDENSLDEDSDVQQNDNKEKEGFMKRMKKVMKDFYEGMTIGKMLFFGFMSVLFVLIGYQLRKREEQSNYVRLPNTE